MPPGTSPERCSEAASRQRSSLRGPCSQGLCRFRWCALQDQLLNAGEAISATSTRQMATGTLRPSPKGRLCSPFRRSSPCGQWSHIQVTKYNPGVSEHVLCALTSDFSIPLLPITASSRVSTQRLSAVPPAPVHPSTQTLITRAFGDTHRVHTRGSRLMGGERVQPAGEENIAADTKMVIFFFGGAGEQIKSPPSEKTPSRKKRSS